MSGGAPQPRPSSPAATPGAGGTPATIEARIGRVLSIGTRLAIGLLAIGSILLVASGTSPLATGWPPLDLATIPSDLLHLQPEGFLWLGLIVTIATPLLRVGAATLGFASAGERRMVLLGVAVLVVLALAVVAGITGG